MKTQIKVDKSDGNWLATAKSGKWYNFASVFGLAVIGSTMVLGAVCVCVFVKMGLKLSQTLKERDDFESRA